MGAAFTPRMATAGATKRWAPLTTSLLVGKRGREASVFVGKACQYAHGPTEAA